MVFHDMMKEITIFVRDKTEGGVVWMVMPAVHELSWMEQQQSNISHWHSKEYAQTLHGGDSRVMR